MSEPTLRIRRLRVLLPARLRATASADGRRIAEAAALALHQQQLAGAGATPATLELPAIRIEGGGRPATALADAVGTQVGSAARERRGG